MKTDDNIGTIGELTEAERNAFEPRKSDLELAREYAERIDALYFEAGELDADICPPDRRFFRGDKEAWVYEHGNIAELVFVRGEQGG